ncbi:MAG: DUF5911 domain-containing protein [Actinomycetota bacterium]|nr:DUF5911 domain-containing protein [Actinomycetota bacterium]
MSGLALGIDLPGATTPNGRNDERAPKPDPDQVPDPPIRPIGDYALLSNSNGAALVAGNGAIEWLCLPRFDSPALFASLLDPSAGSWSITPIGEFESRRRYLPDTLVLETQFSTPSGTGMLTDALLLGHGERGHDIGRSVPHVLVRVFHVTEGSMTLEASFAPRSEYGLVRPRLTQVEGSLEANGGASSVLLDGPPADDVQPSDARWSLDVGVGKRFAFALHVQGNGAPEGSLGPNARSSGASPTRSRRGNRGRRSTTSTRDHRLISCGSAAGSSKA